MSSLPASGTASSAASGKASSAAGSVLLGGSAMVILGASTGVSAVLGDYPVLGGQALRYLVAAAILGAVVLIWTPGRAARVRRTDLVRLTALAATGLAGFNICLLGALRHADPATVGSVVGCTPLVLALVDPLTRRRGPSARVVGAAVLVVVGAALTQGFGHADAVGLVYALGALAGEVAFSLLAVDLLPRLGPLRLSAYVSALAAAMLGPAAALYDGGAMLRLPTLSELAALVYLAVVLTVIAFVLWYTALRALGAERAGLLAGLVPVSAAASQVVLGMGWPSPGQTAGALLVGAGVSLGLTTPHPAPVEAAPAPALEPAAEAR